MSEPTAPIIRHEPLSTTFTGLERSFFNTGGSNVWQFKGIKYGTIPARFYQASMNEKFAPSSSATSFGPKCPQVVTPSRLEGDLIGIPPKYPPQNAPDVFDEFECLNLNITTPPNAHVGSDFPVMVYIHGGGGFLGSNSDWWCDGGGLVSKGVAMKKPVVHVAINYRLAALGNLGSAELRKEHGEANGGNFAYNDMHLALEWIHKYIEPFGGSSTEITLYGESAGSLHTEAQLHSLLPARFSRCILQSQVLGAPLFATPETIATKDSVYTKTKVHLNAKSVKELQQVPWQDLLAAFNASDPRAGFPQVPMIDGLFFDENWRTNYQFARGRSGTIVLGNTAAEHAVIALVLSAAPKPASPPQTSVLITALQCVISGDNLTPLVNAYGLLDGTPLNEVKKSLLLLIEDMAWYAPAQELASIIKSPHPFRTTPVYQYTFAQPNPFSGAFKGVPAHALDLAYLHGDPLIFEGLDQSEKNLQEVMKGSWIRFADGERIWDEVQMLSFGPGGRRVGTDLGVFLKDRKAKWSSFEGLPHAEQEAIAGVVMGHLAQMNGVE